jgi:hypothetical protein
MGGGQDNLATSSLTTRWHQRYSPMSWENRAPCHFGSILNCGSPGVHKSSFLVEQGSVRDKVVLSARNHVVYEDVPIDQLDAVHV